MITEQLVNWAIQGLFFLLILGIVYGFRKPKPRRKHKIRRWFVSTNAILLTVFTAGCSGNYPMLMESQTNFFGRLHELQRWFGLGKPVEEAMGSNRFLLVNVSHDQDLIADQSVNSGWEGRQTITDRRKLTRLLQFLSEDSLGQYVDAVVCDLTFGEPSDSVRQDRALNQVIKELNQQKKLLIAQSALDENAGVKGNSVIDANSLDGGSVDVTTYSGGIFFAHQLFNRDTSVEKGYTKSLPYALFTRLEKIKAVPLLGESSALGFWESSDEKCAWVPGRFMPEYWVDNEDINQEVRESGWDFLTNGGWQNKDSSALFEASGKLLPYLYHLGQLTDRTDTTGLALFRDALLENRQNNHKSIVFIGLFAGSERDIHETVVGPMRGSIIVLNVFLNLVNGSHRISFHYILYLLVGFGCVSLLQLKSYLQLGLFVEGRKKKKHWWPVLLRVTKGLLNSFARFFNENQPYLLTLLILFGAIIFFNHLINIIVVEIYLVFTSRMLDELTVRE